MRTEWFPAHIKPVRKGVYECSYSWGIRFAHWDGKFWGGYSVELNQAYGNRFLPSRHQECAWRGLAKP